MNGNMKSEGSLMADETLSLSFSLNGSRCWPCDRVNGYSPSKHAHMPGRSSRGWGQEDVDGRLQPLSPSISVSSDLRW